MQKRHMIIAAVIFLLILSGAMFLLHKGEVRITHKGTIGQSDVGTVEKIIYGNESAQKSIALVTGMHPRETLSIEPEIEAAKEFANDDVKVIHYRVNVTDSPEDYDAGRANGESLVHDYVNPDVTSTDASCVVIAHSHVPEYGEGFYLATPAMDDASANTAKGISESSGFNYYPVTGKETYKSSSAVLVSKPIAEAGYPTFVYEVPEDVSEGEVTQKTGELFGLLVDRLY